MKGSQIRRSDGDKDKMQDSANEQQAVEVNDRQPFGCGTGRLNRKRQAGCKLCGSRPTMEVGCRNGIEAGAR